MSGNLSLLTLRASLGPVIAVPVHLGTDMSGGDEVSGSSTPGCDRE